VRIPLFNMRALTFEETRILLCKIVKYKKDTLLIMLKEKMKSLIVFRIQKARVFEAFLGITRQSQSFQEHQVGSVGTCLARHTHSSRLLLVVPSIKIISNHPVSNSLGLTKSGETVFLRGLHVSPTSLAWANKNLIRGEGVFLIGPSGIVLGFGEIIEVIQFQKISNYRKIILINHGDIGSYTRTY